MTDPRSSLVTTPAAAGQRSAEVHRNTAETRIRVALNLDGTGQARIATGIGFFDHMLDQIARHGLIDLDIEAHGDIHFDGFGRGEIDARGAARREERQEKETDNIFHRIVDFFHSPSGESSAWRNVSNVRDPRGPRNFKSRTP